ncbi:hypothetical protein ElyMa_003233100 [Elysia marginata]|uniref:G-protein coupled receptors family 1 profile domain-containing protein n=1 Tax=Elysia marginata TaxID=1093978 RepID=A0AAV4J9B7_9GAST|nr:hypothetical protein ElyMa_003233100 [Elysia marginata]
MNENLFLARIFNTLMANLFTVLCCKVSEVRAFRRLLPRPASPSLLQLCAGSCLAQPPPSPACRPLGACPASSSLCYICSPALLSPPPPPNTHAHHVLRCVHHWTYLGPAAILVSSQLALPRSHILLRHTHRHTRTSANKHRNIDKGLE